MKKNLLGKIAVLFGLAFFALFTGCENFLNSDTVKDEITEIIAYNNAPSYVIRVEVDNDTGSLKAPVTGEVTKKVTDVFPVKFAPKSGYQFVRWEAVFTNDRMQDEDIRNYIEFEDENNLETNVTFKRASDSIEIRPVCPKKFTVELESPDTTKSASTPKDTSIVLKFNNPLDPACIEGEWPDWDDEETDWSNTEWAKMFDISISGIDDNKVMSYFKKPVLDASGTRLIIAPDLSVKDGRTNYIPDLENGNKTLTITLNQQYFYYQFTIDKYSKVPEKVTLESPFTKTFVINNETNQKTSVIFKLDDDNTKGRFKVDEKAVDGESHKYSVGKDINLVYNPESGYVFDGWYATYIEKNEQNESVEKQAKLTADILSNYNLSMSYPSDEATFGVNPLTDEARLCLTVLSYSENVITIEPKNKPMVNFSFMPDDDGTGNFMVDEKTYQSAANQYSVSKTIKLKYTPNKKDEYYFDYWLITRTYKDDTGVTKTESIKIKAPESQTAVNPLDAVKDFNLSLTFAEDEEYYGINQDTNVAQAQLSVDDYIDGTITIKPVNKPRVKVSFELDYGNEPDVAPGTLSVNEKSIDSQAGEYSVDKTIKLKYKPSTGFDFDHWLFTRTYKDSTGKVQTQSFTISNMDATTEPAKFKLSIDYAEDEITRPLITINGSVDGSIVIKPVNKLRQNLKFITDTQTGTFSVDEKNLVGDQSEKYSVGKTIKLKYKPADGYIFSHWQFKLGNEEVSSLDAQNLKDKLKLDITYPEDDTTLAIITVSDYKAGEITVKPVNKSRDKITFAVQEENGTATGTLTVDEKSLENQVHEYSVDKTIKLKYKPADGYFFAYWQFKLGDTVTNVRDITSSDLAALNSTMGLELSYPDDEPTQAVITVKDYKAGEIVITPINKSRDKITFAVQEENGTAAGTFTVDEKSLENQAHEYSVGKDISLKYKPADGYLFSHWEFKSGTTKVLVQNGSQTELAALSSVFGFEISYPEEGNLARIILSIKDSYDGTVVVTPVNQARVTIQFKQQKTNNNGNIENNNNNVNTIDFEDCGRYRINDSDCDTQIHEYSVGKTLNLTYKLTSSDYYFKGWSVKKVYEDEADNEEYSQSDFTNENLNRFGLTVSYNDNDSDYGYDSATKTAQVSITIQEYKNDALIVIEPVIELIPTVYVTIEDSNGKISPDPGVYKIKEKIFETLTFTPDSDYEFIRWQIYNKNNDKEIDNADYILIKDLQSQTTSYAVINLPDLNNGNANGDKDEETTEEITFAIRPIVKERPQVLSYSPMYTTQGSLKDESIQVMFDYDMSENSIYYTEDELYALRTRLGIPQGSDESSDGNELLKFTRNNTVHYYGYKYKDKTGTYFKNISIHDNRTTKNLNRCFKNPTFETPKTLSITVDQDDLPSSYTQIAVTIEKDFYYVDKASRKNITLSGSTKWIYQVGNQNDTEDPKIGDATQPFRIQYRNAAGTKQDLEPLTSIPDITDTGSGINNCKFLSTEDGKNNIYFDTSTPIGDNLGISPSFKIYFEKIYDDTYTRCSSNNLESFYYSYEYHVVMGNSAILPESIDLSNLDDGIYCMYFEFNDLSGHKVTIPKQPENLNDTDEGMYYIARDRQAPEFKDDQIEIIDDNKQNTLKAVWDFDSAATKDRKTVYLKYQRDSDGSNTYHELGDGCGSTEVNVSGNNAKYYSLTDLYDASHYSFDVIFEDWAGNKTTYNLHTYTKPATPATVTVPTTTYETTFDVNYTMPEDEYYNKIRVRYRETGSTDENAWVEVEDNTSTSLTQQITELANGKKYDIEVCSYDDRSQKYSLPYADAGGDLPVYVTKPYAATLLSTSFKQNLNSGTITYYTPVSAFSGMKVIYATKSDFSDSTEYIIPNSNTFSSNVQKSITLDSSTTGVLVPGTDYYVKLVAWFDSTDNYAESRTVSTWTKTAPVTNFNYSAKTNDSLTVTWTKPVGNYNSYVLSYKDSASSTWQNVTISDKDAESYTIINLQGGKHYNVMLLAQIASNRQSETENNGDTGWLTYPNAATNITTESLDGSSSASKSIKVTWTEPQGDYSSINIYKCSGQNHLSAAQILDGTVPSDRFVKTIQASSHTTEYTIGGFSAGQFAEIALLTVMSDGTEVLSTVSDIVKCNTSITPVISPRIIYSADSPKSVKLDWGNPNYLNYSKIKIYRTKEGGERELIKTYSRSGQTCAQTHTDTTVEYNTTYTYEIATYKQLTTTDPSTNQTITQDAETALSAGTITTYAAPVTNVWWNPEQPFPEKDFKIGWTNPTDTNQWNEIKIYSYNGSTETLVATITDKSVNFKYFYNQTPATIYNYRIKTTNSKGTESAGVEITANTALKDITNIYLDSSNQTSATYKWTNPSGDFDVTIKYKRSIDSTWSSKSVPAGASSYTITSLMSGYIYNVKLEQSKTGFETKEYTASNCCTNPNVPTNLTVTSRTETSLSFSWTKPTDFPSTGYYYLYYKEKNGSSYSSKYTGNSSTSITVTGLNSSTYYEFYLQAVASSSYPNKVTSTSVKTDITTVRSQDLNTVTNLVAHANNGGVKLTWTAASGIHNYYRIEYKRTSDDDNSWITDYVNSGYTYYTVPSFDRNVSYDFRVASNFDGYGFDIDSAYCSKVTFKTPPPSIVSLTLQTDDAMSGTITVKYTAPSNFSGGVDFFIDDAYKNYTTFSAGTSGTMQLTIPNYKRGTTYTIKARTYIGQTGNEYGSPSWSTSYTNQTYGPPCTLSYKNSEGNITLNGTTYSYSGLVNVTKENVTIGKDINTGGSFTSSNSITLTPYTIGKYVVTQELFEAVMGTNPSQSTGSSKPATNFTWYAAIAFCNKLSVLLGLDPCYTVGSYSNNDWKTFTYDKIPTSNDSTWNNATCNFTKNGYHLPTEYQWEFAARGGNQTFYGTAVTNSTKWNYTYSGSNTATDVAWFSTNSSGALQNVGQKSPNILLLYDMSGNVWEMTNDWGSSSVPAVTETDFTVPYNSTYSDKSTIIYRGGAYCSSAYSISKRLMTCSPTRAAGYDVGFRVCRNKTYQ